MSRKASLPPNETVSDLRDTAFALFGRYGHDGVSVADISAGTGLSKGALYWHFSGKSDLFLDCLQRLHRIFEDAIIAPMQSQPDAGRRILQLFRGIDEVLHDPRVVDGVGGFWLATPNAGSGEIRAAQRAFENRMTRAIHETLSAGVDAGLLDLGEELASMSRTLTALIQAIILPLGHQPAEETREVLAVLARTLFRAYATTAETARLADDL